MSYALLFSGQGSQHPEMLPWLEHAAPARPMLEALGGIAGADWRRQLGAGTCSARNAFAQPLVTGTALAAWAALQPLLPEPPAIVAGYSVGELAAFAAAGALAPLQALELAQLRARAMDDAVAGHDTGLLAISAVAEGEVLKACPALECAIRIDRDNNVFGGSRAALDEARQRLAHRAQFKPICVALASHTSWMRAALPAFTRAVQAAGLRTPACAIATNATGSGTRSPATLAAALAAQIQQTVQWSACMETIAERRPAFVLEIGGGRALARMWSARHPGVPARSLDDFRSVEAAAAWAAALL